MGLFDSGSPSITVAVDVLFPSNVTSGPGITVNKTNSVWSVNVDIVDLTENTSISTPSGYFVMVWDTALARLEKVRLDNLNLPTLVDFRSPIGDANYAVLVTDRCVGLTATLTAIRTITLPAASTVPAGRQVVIQDEVGGISPAFYHSIVPTGADTINGGASWIQKTTRGGTIFRSNGSNAWNVLVITGRSAVADAPYTATAGDLLIAYASITAARTVTLPAAAAYQKGQQLTIIDESGACSATNTIGITRAGADTINGVTSLTLNQAYAYVALESDGVSKWTIADSSTFASTQISDSTPVGRALVMAASAAAGRTTLGAAASGANTDITSLAGLTTPLSVTQGGTGANAAGGARTALGLGTSAVLNVGTVAAGNDSRVTGALQTSGGTMTGSLTVSNSLAVNPPANTPQYVGNAWGHLGGTTGGGGYVASNLYSDGASGIWKIGATHGSLGFGVLQVTSTGLSYAGAAGSVTANQTITPTFYRVWTAADFNYTPQPNLGYTPLNKAGDTLTGTITVPNGVSIYAPGDLGTVVVQSTFSAATKSGVNVSAIGAWSGGLAGYIAYAARIDRSDCYLAYFQFGTGNVGTITSSGVAVAYNTSSDARRKDHVRPLADEIDIGSLVDALKPRAWEWNDVADRPTDHGFVAQELHTIAPRAVSPGDDDPNRRPGDEGFRQWGVDPAKLVPYLVAELQSLRRRVAELEAKNG